MLTSMRLKNFKCWKDTGEVELSRLNLFFGANSSGKSSLMQALLLLKQSTKTMNRDQIINFGDDDDMIRLSSFNNIIRDGEERNALEFNLSWRPTIKFTLPIENKLLEFDEINFHNAIVLDSIPSDNGKPYKILKLKNFSYKLDSKDTGNLIELGMKLNDRRYEIIQHNYKLEPVVSEELHLNGSSESIKPVFFFGFPEKLRTQYQNTNTLFDLEWELGSQLDKIVYLGPLRSHPERLYSWSPGQGDSIDVGFDGKKAIQALLSDRYRHERGEVFGTAETAEKKVERWLQEMELIDSFDIKEEAANIYTVLIQVRGNKHNSI